MMERVEGRVPSDNPPVRDDRLGPRRARRSPAPPAGRVRLGVRPDPSRRLAGVGTGRGREPFRRHRPWRRSSPGGPTISTGRPTASPPAACATRARGAPRTCPPANLRPRSVGATSGSRTSCSTTTSAPARCSTGRWPRSARPSSTSAGISSSTGMTTDATGDLPGFHARDHVLRAYESQLGRALHDLSGTRRGPRSARHRSWSGSPACSTTSAWSPTSACRNTTRRSSSSKSSSK